eukprot:sb/3461938/
MRLYCFAFIKMRLYCVYTASIMRRQRVGTASIVQSPQIANCRVRDQLSHTDCTSRNLAFPTGQRFTNYSEQNGKRPQQATKTPVGQYGRFQAMVSQKIKIIIGISVACGIAIAAAIVVVLVLYLPGDNNLTVTTATSGKIKGLKTELSDGTSIYSYYNIKYGIAPVYDLRFKPPVAHTVTADTAVDGTNTADIQCIQFDLGGGVEDCLVLTVMTPDPSGSRPVIVWIHGGGVLTGYGNAKGYSFDAETTQLVDSVTVNINYRLGFLGFSAIEELWEPDVHYANAGIRDMVLALKWVKDNIASFGGNPDKVMILGESGGATAVMTLVGSPLANNLFSTAVALSPAIEVRHNYTQTDDLEFQRIFVDTFCGDKTSNNETAACLRELSPSKFSVLALALELGEGATSAMGSGYFDFPMRYGETGEHVGCVVTDPIVYPQNNRELSSATFTPSSEVTVVVSNLREENAYMVTSNTFDSYTELNTTLGELFPNITSDAQILDKFYEMYPGLDATDIWNYLTSDLRSTCPINDVVTIMEGATNRDILRLFIPYRTTVLTESIPAFHAKDTIALFGYKMDAFSDTSQYITDKSLRTELVSMLKNLGNGEGYVDGWVEGKTLSIENKDPAARSGVATPVLTDEKARASVCEEWGNMDLTNDCLAPRPHLRGMAPPYSSVSNSHCPLSFGQKDIIVQIRNHTLNVFLRDISINLRQVGVESDAQILDKFYEMYPGLDATDIWNYLTSDLRSTCPINDVVTIMEGATNRDILRLFIPYRTTVLTESIPAFHAKDTIALFGYKMDAFSDTSQYITDKSLRTELVSMLKNLGNGEGYVDGWVEGKTLSIENKDPAARSGVATPVLTDEKARASVCEEWGNMDLTKTELIL